MHRPAQQSKVTLMKSSNKKSRYSCARTIISCLVAIGILLGYGNLQMIRSTSSKSEIQMIRSTPSKPERNAPLDPSSLPMMPPMPYPPMKTPQMTPTLVQGWDRWAETPILGSYQYSKSDYIHFPYMDLQTVYHDTNPNFHVAVRGLPPPASVLKNTHFPNADAFLLTRKGNKFPVSANQDRSVVLSFNNQDWWMGLFDGHGEFGHVVSQYASLEFPKRLGQILPNNNNVEEFLREIFLGIHHSMPNISGAGSTAISIWKRQNLLYISNVGDSQAFVASFDRNNGNDVRIVYQTKPHKPDSPEEQKRIELKGGEVQPPPFPKASARVLIPLGNGMVWGLAMSRSLGDHEGEPYGVIPEPTTEVLKLSDLDPKLEYMVVAASDGLFDHVPLLEVAQHVAKSFLPSSSLLPLAAAEELILKSSKEWLLDPLAGGGYRDDISIAVHRLRVGN